MGSNTRYTEEQIAASRRQAPGSKVREVHFYSVDQWSDDGRNLEEVLARAEGFAIAVGAYEAALKSKPHYHITLRNGAHVYRQRPASDKGGSPAEEIGFSA